jgi:putative membrane protein
VKALTILGLIGGALLATLLIAFFGVGAVGRALLAIGWGGFVVLCAYHLVLIGLCGVAWSALLPKPRPVALWAFAWGRLLRDAGSEVLPLSQLGGYVMGARAVTLTGLRGALAVASTIVDVTLELMAQLAYAALGLALLARLRPDSGLGNAVAIGLAVAFALTIGFIIAQQRGVGLAERMVRRWAGQWLGSATTDAAGLQEAIRTIYRRSRGLWLGFLLHFAAWLAGGIEAWLALRLMHAPLGLDAVIAIESLLYAIRSVAFAVPNALGVQEGAYVMLGSLFGLSPDIALALSLLKRARDVVLGCPPLLWWQFLEGGRLLRRRAVDRQTAP